MRLLKILFIGAIFLAQYAFSAFATSIPMPYGKSAEIDFSEADAVFSGKVVDIQKTYEDGKPEKLKSKISFKVDKVWKGIQQPDVQVEINILNYKSCTGYYDDLEMNEQYLVFIGKDGLASNLDCHVEWHTTNQPSSIPPPPPLPLLITKISYLAHTKSPSDMNHTRLEEYMGVLGKPIITFEHKE